MYVCMYVICTYISYTHTCIYELCLCVCACAHVCIMTDRLPFFVFIYLLFYIPFKFPSLSLLKHF